MACANIPLVIQRVQEKTDTEDQDGPLIKFYAPQGPLPVAKRPLHALLQKQPDLLGSIQMVNGLFAFALEIVLAVTIPKNDESLYVILRISFLTGPCFFIAGLLLNLLYKFPGLLSICYIFNWAGIVMATLELAIISVDMAMWDEKNRNRLTLELMEVCVMGLNLILSIILCGCIHRERNRQFSNNE